MPQMSAEIAGLYRERLRSASWVGFDLDDTLHEFRSASTQASSAVFRAISGKHGIPTTVLKDQYAVILHETTSHAFSDGRTSTDYRRERFTALLDAFSLPVQQPLIQDLLALYESSLKAALKLKPGALSLLETFVSIGKKIVVITEGPQDAQEWTIENLGIARYIDFLATTNKFGVSKTNGLFAKVLEHLDITAREIVYVGDNLNRDVEPAAKEGILSIYLADKEGSWSTDRFFSVQGLDEVKELVSPSHSLISPRPSTTNIKNMALPKATRIRLQRAFIFLENRMSNENAQKFRKLQCRRMGLAKQEWQAVKALLACNESLGTLVQRDAFFAEQIAG
ncbi:HAD-like domain-containing protein [Aspergillus heterothallicus]